MICAAILSPIVMLIRTVIGIIRTVVETVCDWVSTILTTTKEVVEEVCKWVEEKICKWLPWPFNKLCEWVRKLVCWTVTKVIEVTETIWEWVCEEVLKRIIEWVEIVLEYVIYVFKWVCWVVDWVFRLPGLLACRLGAHPQRFMGVCVKILADNSGTPAVPVATVEGWLRDSAAILANCNITLQVCGVEIVRKPEYLNSTTCEGGGMFRRFFTWFSTNSCGCCRNVTVYVVNDIQGASGCAYPGTDWVTVDAAGSGGTIVQEIGHLADLWGHSSDPNNVMTDQPGGTADQITDHQCCMIRTSRFAHGTPVCPRLISDDVGTATGGLESADKERKAHHDDGHSHHDH